MELKTILKEADKWYSGEKFSEELKEHSIKLSNDGYWIRLYEADQIGHDHLQIAYKAGQEEGWNNGFTVASMNAPEEVKKIREQTLKQIEEWCENKKVKSDNIDVLFGLGVNQALDDLKKFINTL